MGFRMKIGRHGAILREGGQQRRLTHQEAIATLRDTNRTITKLHSTWKIQSVEGNPLSHWLRNFQGSLDTGISPHGERVEVTLSSGSYFRKRRWRGGYMLRVRFRAHTESGRAVYDRGDIKLWFQYDNGYTDWVEATRCLIQCAESGASATDQDLAALHAAFAREIELQNGG